ncbi:MAG: thioredoxin family protein [Luteolibacter sp.]
MISLPGCERVRKLADSVGKKAPAVGNVPANIGPLIVEIPDGAYETFLKQKDRLVIVDFDADWSGPSKQLATLCEKITTERGGVVIVGKVNVDHFRELAKIEGVQNVPDVRIYRNGRMVERFVGLPDEDEMRQKVDFHAKGLTVAALLARGNPAPHPTTQPMTKDWIPEGVRRR